MVEGFPLHLMQEVVLGVESKERGGVGSEELRDSREEGESARGSSRACWMYVSLRRGKK
jgi:hypothetical protein